jgi:hypothetical protein
MNPCICLLLMRRLARAQVIARQKPTSTSEAETRVLCRLKRITVAGTAVSYLITYRSYIPRTSSTHVNENGPPARRNAGCPQAAGGIVEGIRNVVQVKLGRGDQCLVDPFSHLWAVFIVHGPAASVSDCLRPTATEGHPPHRCDHAAEARREQRSSEVHGLVRLLRVALGGLACAEKGQNGVRRAQPHERLDG